MMEFVYKILLSEDVFNKMNIFGFIFEKKITFASEIPKYLFVSLNWASRRRVQVLFKNKNHREQ